MNDPRPETVARFEAVASAVNDDVVPVKRAALLADEMVAEEVDRCVEIVTAFGDGRLGIGVDLLEALRAVRDSQVKGGDDE